MSLLTLEAAVGRSLVQRSIPGRTAFAESSVAGFSTDVALCVLSFDRNAKTIQRKLDDLFLSSPAPHRGCQWTGQK